MSLAVVHAQRRRFVLSIEQEMPRTMERAKIIMSY